MKYKDKEAKVLYVDSHILVAEKPGGLLTQNSPTSDESLETFVQAYLEREKKSLFLHAVHRLDKEVSGLVLFAKSSKALSRLNEQVRKKEIIRLYEALIEGRLLQKEGVLKHTLIHGSHRAKVEEGGKIALLSYRVLGYEENFTRLEIFLDTGRYHQIRAQFSSIGHPIAGDAKYGSLMCKKAIFLHQKELRFIHPVTKENLIFTSDVPF